jgi:hypothetical protein
MAESPRRFPAPWHADPMPGGYVVRDANGQALAYLYSRDNDAEAQQAKVLTKDEARRIAVNTALLPEPLREPLARRRLSSSRSRVLILPAQEFGGVCLPSWS